MIQFIVRVRYNSSRLDERNAEKKPHEAFQYAQPIVFLP